MLVKPIANYIPDGTLITSITATCFLKLGWPQSPLLPRAFTFVGIGVALTGGFLAIAALRLLRKQSASTNVTVTSNKLVRNDIYRFSRNPVYLAYLLTSLGVSLAFRNTLGLIPPLGVFVVLNSIVIPIEEKELAAKFKDEYQVYKTQVRRWI